MASSSILLVEDNPDDEDLVLRSLRRAGIANEVLVARDGAEATALLYEEGRGLVATGRVPALVLLDLKLPKVGGFDVLRRIRSEKATRFMPVVILTSSSEDEDVVRGYASGANSYVRKPVDFSEFATAVQRLGLFWLIVNTVPHVLE